MRHKLHRLIVGLSTCGWLLITGLPLPAIHAQAPERSEGWAQVDCDKEHAGALQRAIDAAGPGDTIRVSGTCNENLLIPLNADRLTLDGGGTAAIHGPDPTLNTIQARAVRQLTVRGFAISGGRAGVSIDRGATALIDGNTIEFTGRFGIIIGSWSTANIVNNTIQNNGSHGIQVNGNAFAFIGFGNADDTVASPNLIRTNGGHGVFLSLSASARIAGNTISNNSRNGIHVERASQATISSNTINANRLSGIYVTENAGGNLGSDTGVGLFDAPNSTTVNNGRYGVECFVGGYVNGRRGTLNGTAGAKVSGTSCVDSLDASDQF
jgi:parallel beta-helix repeat protein